MESEPITHVGPVLRGGPTGRAVAEAIVASNPGANIIDRSGYVRVLVPTTCTVTREAIEQSLGRTFRLRDLEAVMVSYQGRLDLSEEQAVWTTEPDH